MFKIGDRVKRCSIQHIAGTIIQVTESIGGWPISLIEWDNNFMCWYDEDDLEFADNGLERAIRKANEI